MPRRRIPANITDRIKKLLPKTPLMHLVLATLPFFSMDSEGHVGTQGGKASYKVLDPHKGSYSLLELPRES